MKEKSWKSKIQWLVDFDGKMTALFGKNVRLRMDGIKGMVWDLLGELEVKMKEELLFFEKSWDLEKKGLMVDMNLLVDDWRNKGIRYSFVGDERNLREGGALGFNGSTWLLRRVMREKKLRSLFMVRKVVEGKEN